MFPKKGEYCTTDKSIFFRCPKCGEIATIDNHTVDADGKVNPSVVCPYECGFHDYIRLMDWKK